MRRVSLAFCLPLALFGTSSCLVAGLEVGPGQDAAGSAGSLGAFGGSRFGSAAGSGGSPASGDANAGGVTTTGGNAGDVGGAVRCEDHPISEKSRWSVTASSSSLGNGVETDPLYNPPSHVADGALDERWASGQPQEDGQWFHVDFGVEVALSHVILQQGRDLDDFPRGYEISL
ncbi:MAG TPA: discoidin domain-containing protein [Polyangiaceae bacterium]|nr:discoidin domain-containing protein [Polyangiaceae bacterium]